ncbi:DUF5330 domain-containing protein [Blastochloris sulfoviridis]|uniref:DUF5330 domain-containing protein n=1 Tax=Blastochloris sulfoviridis TaxID=50712 RepID=A0A5M6I4W9_9HYPH|nr:DUF5330 domain-containing protein [Blastochloris sulfoviridis]KAA5602849.1 hypothetical protein F1193_03145 [Blastochloris sulfoviridis]
MGFLLRAALLLVVVLALIPTGSGTDSRTGAIGAGDAMSAAQAAIEDARGFCTRQPDACAFAGRFASALTDKAEAAAKMLYEFLRDQSNSHANPATTGSASEAADAQAADTQAATHTLAPSERGVPWRAPDAPPRRHE